jgi:squalene-hopene/tetraprenyl-beta-curcumene cyclase
LDPIRDTALAALALAGSDPGNPALQRAADWLLAHPGGIPLDDAASVVLALAAAQRTTGADALKDGGSDDSADVTGRVLEALAAPGHPAVRRGVAWLVEHQESDGSWRGEWGVAYLYGTCFALRGLAAAGESDREAHILRAGEWIRSIQNADGGWGESCASFDNGGFTAAPSTPSQTAWAILGLIAGGDPDSLSVRHGIDYLVRTQRADGSWDEDAPTAVVLPKAVYARAELYKDCFPPMALAAFAKARLDG